MEKYIKPRKLMMEEKLRIPDLDIAPLGNIML